MKQNQSYAWPADVSWNTQMSCLNFLTSSWFYKKSKMGEMVNKIICIFASIHMAFHLLI